MNHFYNENTLTQNTKLRDILDLLRIIKYLFKDS